jgi:hypothetical protein
MIMISMDMPSECHECPFQMKFKDGEIDNWYVRRCMLEKRRIEYPRPQWCPLKYLDNVIKDAVNTMQWVQEYIDAAGEEHKKEYIKGLQNEMDRFMKLIRKEEEE